MYESARLWLYIFLGFVPTLFFASRFIIQWFSSERRKKSYTPVIFWYLSIVGNCLQGLHYFFQMQLPFMLIQISNAYIAWRHLRLRAHYPSLSFTRGTITLLGLILFGTLFHYGHMSISGIWVPLFHTPRALMKNALPLPHIWILIGGLGGMVFGFRFWIQWWQSEKNPSTSFSKPFWWLSIVGSFLLFFYFLRIGDWVSCSNTIFGVIPYARNLLLQKEPYSKKALATSEC